MLITDEYKEMNQKMHREKKLYGSYGNRWTEHVLRLAVDVGTEDVLDYGCGKGTLAANMPFDIKQYDPGIPKYEKLPEAADIVVCTDVLEHIEPNCIESVFNHLYLLTKKVIFLVIHNGAAGKHLPDGRNAHLIQKDESYWLGGLFLPRFMLRHFIANIGADHGKEHDVLEYMMMGHPHPAFNVKSKDEEKS